MGKTLNFDNFISEQKREIIEVTVLGKKYEVLAQIPAVVPVMMARAEVSRDAHASQKMIMNAADAMFGRDSVDEMCANGLSTTQLADLVSELFKKINGPDDADEAEELRDDADSVPAPGTKPKKSQ
jgi:hypothetical protein